jgi:hypothetical protein
VFKTNNQPANAYNLQKRIPLIINELSTKTHENTGNKPAKPETPCTIILKKDYNHNKYKFMAMVLARPVTSTGL